MPKKVKRPAQKVEEVDRFVLLFERVRTVFVQNWRLFTIGFVIVALVVVVTFLWMRNLQRREKYASFLLFQGVTKLQEAGDLTGEEGGSAYNEALTTLSALVDEYGGTESGKLGLLYRGKCLSRLKRYGEAIEQYEAFLSLDESSQLYRSLALKSLGFAYENEKEYEKALGCFKELTEMEESFLRGESILAQGRIYEEMGQQKEALDVYRTFLEQYPDSPQSDRIQRKVALIEAAIR